MSQPAWRPEDAPRPGTWIIDALPFGVVVAELDGRAVTANLAWSQLTRAAWEDHRWLDVCRNEDREELLAAVQQGTGHQLDLQDENAPDRTLHLELFRRAQGVASVAVVTLTDVTEERTRTARLVKEAAHDPLTGLCNRSTFLREVGLALDRHDRDASRVPAILFIDVDGLKATNDTLGHATGDRLIQHVAARIRGAVRPFDIVARMGGDEFTVLCEGLGGVEEAAAVAERIRAAVSDPDGDGGLVGVAISIGLATPGAERLDAIAFVGEADRAMYRSRRRAMHVWTEDDAVGTEVPAAATSLRAPLTTILRSVGRLRQDARLDDQHAEEPLRTIEHEALRLAALIDDLVPTGQEEDAASAGP